MKRATVVLSAIAILIASGQVVAQETGDESNIQKEEVGPHYQHLKELEYFAGDWRTDGKMETDYEPLAELTEGRMKQLFSYKWMMGKSFLTLYIREDRKSPVAYHAVIGWDAAKKQIRSRDFNAQGAWFEYIHIKTDKGWVIEGTSTFPGGAEGTFRGVATIIDNDTFSYKGSGVMKLDGKEVAVKLTYEATRRKPREKK